MNKLGYPYDVPFGRLEDLMTVEQAEALAKAIHTFYGVADVIEGSILALKQAGVTGNCAVRFAIAAGIQFIARHAKPNGIPNGAYNEAAQRREDAERRATLVYNLTKLLDDPMFATEMKEAA